VFHPCSIRDLAGRDAKPSIQRLKLLWRKDEGMNNEIGWWGERPREPLGQISALFQ
jgi:hypothetical protein